MSAAPRSGKFAALPATISMLAARPARRSVFSSLRFRLLLAILVPFIAAFGLILYETIDRRTYAVQHSRFQVKELLNLAATQEKQGLDQAHHLLATLAQLSCVRRLDVAECNSLFAELIAQNPRYNNIALIGPEGDALASGVPLAGITEVRSRVWYQRAVKTRRFAVGDFMIGRVTKMASIHLAQPMIVPQKEEVPAVLMAAINLGYLADLLPTKLP